MTEAQQIVRHLLEDEEVDDFADADWKEITTDLPSLLDEAGFFKTSTYTWVYKINKWMTNQVQLRGDRWYGRVMFETMVINEFEGTDIEIARWLESSGNWPEGHFTDWNRFAAAAAGKTIREDEDDDGSLDVGIPAPIEPLIQQSGYARPNHTTPYFTAGRGWIKRIGDMVAYISDPHLEGGRTITLISGNVPLWNLEFSDEDTIDFLDRMGSLKRYA